jgi:hypothetical protein
MRRTLIRLLVAGAAVAALAVAGTVSAGGPGRDTLVGGKGADQAKSDVRDTLSGVEGAI